MTTYFCEEREGRPDSQGRRRCSESCPTTSVKRLGPEGLLNECRSPVVLKGPKKDSSQTPSYFPVESRLGDGCEDLESFGGTGVFCRQDPSVVPKTFRGDLYGLNSCGTVVVPKGSMDSLVGCWVTKTKVFYLYSGQPVTTVLV